MSLSEIFGGLQDWVIQALVLAGGALAGIILHRLVLIVGSKLAERTSTPADDALIANLRRPAGLLLPATGALFALPLAPGSDVEPALRHALVVLVIGAIGWCAHGVLRAIGDIVVARFRIDHTDNLAQRQVQTRMLIINRIASVVVTIVTCALVLMTFPSIRNVGVSLIASAGVVGVIFGLAARPTIGNIIAGVQVALTQPIRIDDVVIVEGEWGWIEEITTTYVVVRIWDQRRLVVPISQFIEKPFQNWTRTTADIIGTVFFHADYTVPVGELRDELNRLVKDHKKWDGRVCVLQVTGATERSVELRALVSAATSPDAWDLRCDVREGLIAYLQREHPECLPRIRAEVEGGDEGHPDAKPQAEGA
jgi:small-conductance mechanosensitive channel